MILRDQRFVTAYRSHLQGSKSVNNQQHTLLKKPRTVKNSYKLGQKSEISQIFSVLIAYQQRPKRTLWKKQKR
jgi:hypothetical protein